MDIPSVFALVANWQEIAVEIVPESRATRKLTHYRNLVSPSFWIRILLLSGCQFFRQLTRINRMR